MKILFIVLLTIAANSYAGETVVGARPKQADMTIAYETRKDAKDAMKHEMVVTHPTGVVSFYDEKDLLEWRTEAVKRLAEINAEITRIDAQIAEIKKLEVKVKP